MRKNGNVFDEYGNYKYPDYSNSQYTHDVSTTGGAIDTMRKYQQLQADYEKRLKADMVDILLDVQNEIKQKELEAWGYPNIEYSKGLKLTVDIIQKKIRALKENTNGNV